jgi:hypothetical protein
MPGMDVVAQWVRTTWTKHSRGGAGARRRGMVPVAFPLPEAGSPMVHEVTVDERLVPHTVLRHAEPDPDEVELTEENALLRVHLVAVPASGPARWRRPPAVRLARGQWLRWQINYRFAFCCGDGHYRQDTLNLAYGKVAANVFQGEPTRRVDERASRL